MALRIEQKYGKYSVKDGDGRIVAGPYRSRHNAARALRDALTKNTANNAPVVKERNFMTCTQPFESTWVGHRLCNRCRTLTEGLI